MGEIVKKNFFVHKSILLIFKYFIGTHGRIHKHHYWTRVKLWLSKYKVKLNA